jgi:galactokinase
MICFRAVFSLPSRFTQMGSRGMFQISSDVPEGKGVSSSAALEVATMSAIAAAYGKFLAYESVMIFWQRSLVAYLF